MEIIEYVSTTDGFTHYLFNNSMGIPFFLWVLILVSSCALVCLILNRILGSN